MSPRYSVDSVLTFVGNNMEGKSITLHHPVGTDAGKVVIENNYLSNITLNNASELVVSDNRGNSSNGHAGKFFFDTCKIITISNIRAKGL